MTKTGLQPGDKVIELAAVVRGVTLVTGGTAGTITAWLAKHEIGLTMGFAVGGSVIGYLVGRAVAKLLFPATAGDVVVTGAGRSSLPLTLKGGVVGALISSALVSILASVVTGAEITTGIWPSLGVGVLVGAGFACISSLS